MARVEKSAATGIGVAARVERGTSPAAADEASGRLGRRVIRHGFILFLLGLLTGFMIPLLANPRMALTSHLEGLMNGTFLIAVGLAWPHLRLGGWAAAAAFWLLLYGTYANWFATLLAAHWATGRLTPIAAPGMEGTAVQEAIVNFGLISLALAIVPALGILVWGMRGAPPPARRGGPALSGAGRR
jgi:(hydroxyamino)benzene mutase